MKWIMAVQRPQGNRIGYLTDEMDDYSSMDYWKFLEFIQKNFNVINFHKFKDEIDSFSWVFVMGHEWFTENHPVFKEFMGEEDKPPASFEELLKLNQNLYETADEKRKKEKENDVMTQLEKRIKDKKFGRNSKPLKFFDTFFKGSQSKLNPLRFFD